MSTLKKHLKDVVNVGTSFGQKIETHTRKVMKTKVGHVSRRPDLVDDSNDLSNVRTQQIVNSGEYMSPHREAVPVSQQQNQRGIGGSLL